MRRKIEERGKIRTKLEKNTVRRKGKKAVEKEGNM